MKEIDVPAAGTKSFDITKNMKTLAIFLSLILFVAFLSAQETPKDILSNKELQERNKEEKEAKLQKQYETFYKILLDRSFVLEANSVEGKDGHQINVNSRINFLIIDTLNSVLQVGYDTNIGYNGVGGATAKGKITSYKISRNDKHKSFIVSMMVNTLSGHCSVQINISASGMAKAWVSGMTNGQFGYNGHIVPLSESNLVEGNIY